MKFKWSGVLFFVLSMVCFSSMAAVQHWRLNNGLQVIVLEDHRSPVVLCSVWYKVGGANEHNGITGISHFLEHMMFLGTKRFPGDDFAHQIEKVGGMSNAFTGSDLTVYYEELPKQYLSLAIDLEADRMQHLSLSKALFKTEKSVIKEERRMRVSDNPVSLGIEKLRAATFMNSPYQHPVVGWMTDIDALSVSDLSRWYDRWYVPNNAVLVIAGDVSVGDVKPLVNRYFSQVPRRELQESKPRKPIGFAGKQRLTINHPAVRTKMIFRYFSAPSMRENSDNTQVYSLMLLDAMLTGDNGSRLDKEWVQKGQWADGVGSSYSPFHFYPGTFSLSLVLSKSAEMMQVQKNIDDLNLYFLKYPLTEKELIRAKAKVIAAALYQEDTLMGRASQAAYPFIFGGQIMDEAMFSKKIHSVTLGQVRRIEKNIFSDDASSSLWLLPKTVEVVK